MFYVSMCSEKEGGWLNYIFYLFSHMPKVLGQLVYLIHHKSCNIAGQEWNLMLS